VSVDPKARGQVLLVLGVLCASLALVAFAFPDLFFGFEPFQGTDWLQLHLPNKVYAAEVLRSGRLPLWNPYVSLGRPFMADVETAVLYPPNLLYLVLDVRTALVVLTIAHYALGLFGVLALGRALGVPRWAAWLAAGCFLWSGPVVANLSSGLVPYSHGICYLPLLFLLALRLQDRFSGGRLAALAAVLALQLVCGHPQIAWISWLGIGAFLLGRGLPPAPRPVRHLALGLGGFAVALGAAFALAAPMLLPLAELVSQGNRVEPSVTFAAGGTMDWWQWASLTMPDGGRRVFSWEANMYAGLLPVVAGLAGLVLPRDRNARGLLAAALAGGLVATGTRTPAFAVLYHLVPGLSSFHIHARAGLLVVFALIFAAALFLSRERLTRRSAALLVGGAGLVVLGPVAFRVLAPAPEAAHEPFPTGRLALGLTVAVLAGLSVRLRPGRRVVISRVALAAVVLVELGVALGPARRVWMFPVPTLGERPLFDGLLRAGLYPKSGVPPRVAVPPWSIRQNAALLYKWSNIAGYNALTLNRVWIFLHESLGLMPSLDENTYPSRHIYEHGPFPYDSMNLVAGWRIESPAPAAVHVRESRAYVGWRPAPGQPVLRRPQDPRAYLATTVRRVGDWREAVTMMASGHDFHATALVETDTGLPTSAPEGASPEPGHAEIVSYEPERVVVRTDAPAPSLLVLAEAWYPGWSATVDGSRAECLPANAWMRAVPVPAGHHRVVLRFRSRWLLPGALVSLSAAALLAVLVRRDRRSGPLETTPAGAGGPAAT
jgi:hypothetical protein